MLSPEIKMEGKHAHFNENEWWKWWCRWHSDVIGIVITKASNHNEVINQAKRSHLSNKSDVFVIVYWSFCKIWQPCDQLGHTGKCQYSIAAINYKRLESN